MCRGQLGGGFSVEKQYQVISPEITQDIFIEQLLHSRLWWYSNKPNKFLFLSYLHSRKRCKQKDTDINTETQIKGRQGAYLWDQYLGKVKSQYKGSKMESITFIKHQGSQCDLSKGDKEESLNKSLNRSQITCWNNHSFFAVYECFPHSVVTLPHFRDGGKSLNKKACNQQ